MSLVTDWYSEIKITKNIWYFARLFVPLSIFGEVLEWLKRHAWKACNRQNRFAGSNPVLSARTGSKLRGKTSGLCCSLREAREKDSKLLGERNPVLSAGFKAPRQKLRGFVVLSATPYFYDLRTKLVNSSFFSRKGCTFAAANLTKLIPNEKKNCFHGCDSHSRHDHLGWRIDD